jgi:hypothetical protein
MPSYEGDDVAAGRHNPEALRLRVVEGCAYERRSNSPPLVLWRDFGVGEDAGIALSAIDGNCHPVRRIQFETMCRLIVPNVHVRSTSQNIG